MTEPGFASPAAILADSLAAFLPPARQTVAEHAADHRLLHNTGGGYVGPYRHELAPYLREPMEQLTNRDVQTIAISGPGQSGKTTIAENWLLYSVDVDPGNLLWYMQTDDAVEAYVKGTINPMIDGHDELRNKLGLRPVDDSLHFKRFRAMYVEFLSATLKTLINKKAPRLVADEIDAYPAGLGDVKALLDVRRQTFGRASKLLMLSHPDQARGVNPETDWTAGIMAVYADSTRCTWWWPCPHCGAWSSPNPTAARVTTIDYPVDGSLDEIQAAARLLCPVNGCLIEDHLRREMNSRARWVGAGQEITEGGDVTGERIRHPVAGYWIVGAMSPFVMGGIGGLARARVKAERELEVSGEDGTLRQVIVKQWGIPYSPQRGASSVDAATLVERCEPTLALARVPLGVRFLTVSADIQIAHFEWLVRGWGVNGESWVIDRGRLPADPATSPSDWDKLLAEVFLRAYELADGSGRVMAIRGAGFDTGGAPGVTQQAYAAWTRWRRTRLRLQDGRVGSPVRGYGKISGRDVFSIQGLKGNSKPNASKLSVTYPDTARKANAVAGRGIVPVGMFNANLFKDDLGGQLQQGQAGDWYVHFPTALKSKDPPHVFFEQLVSEVPDKLGRWTKINPNARNEALDLMVMSHVVAYLNGLTRIDWEKPPSWAAPWDDNSLVFSDAPAPAPVPPASTGAVTVTTQAPAAEPRRSIVKKLAS